MDIQYYVWYHIWFDHLLPHPVPPIIVTDVRHSHTFHNININQYMITYININIILKKWYCLVLPSSTFFMQQEHLHTLIINNYYMSFYSYPVLGILIVIIFSFTVPWVITIVCCWADCYFSALNLATGCRVMTASVVITLIFQTSFGVLDRLTDGQ